MPQARKTLLTASEQLIARWRAAAAAAAATAAATTAATAARAGGTNAECGQPQEVAGAGKQVAAGGKGEGAGPLSGVQAGSFLDVLLAEKNSAMSDLTIMAQVR